MEPEHVEGKKKRRKCVSKAERLAKKSAAGTLTEEQRQSQIQQLVESNRSEDWDAASRLVSSSPSQLLFLMGLLNKQQSKAAAHYLKRWDLSPLGELPALLEAPPLASLLQDDPSTAATFLNHVADGTTMPPSTLYYLLNRFVLPWITTEKEAPLQALLHDFSSLKWLLVEHALVTGQGRHLVNQYAYVCRDLRGFSLAPWWSNDLREDSSADVRERIRQDVETSVRLAWPDASVRLFGSSLTNLCRATDDVDLCVLVPSVPVRGADSADLVVDIHGHLALYRPSPESIVVRNARIPVIKTQDPTTHLGIDLCVNNTAALWNSALLCAFLRHFPPLEALCQCIRQWAKARALVGSSHSLSSYSMVLLVVHWLQVRGFLPFVDVAMDDAIDVSGAAIDAAVARAFDEASMPSTAPPPPPLSVLLLDFFIFWASEFPYATHVASLRRREMLKDKPTAQLYLEDPIETKRNLGSYLNRDSQRTLRNEMLRVCVLVRQSAQHPPHHLLPQSLAFGRPPGMPPIDYVDDSLQSCLLRPRSPKSQWCTMTGDVVHGERAYVQISTVASSTEAQAALSVVRQHSCVGVDCEGVALSRTGRICVISVAVGFHVYLFDVMVAPALTEMLKPMLEDTATLKVLHDCRKDSDALFHQFGISLANVFDTQVGHAIGQLQRIKKVKEGTKCMQVSAESVVSLGNAHHECLAFGDLLWQYLSIHEDDKADVKKSMTEATWTVRPLSTQLQHYAAVDVVYLPVLYRVMAASLSVDAQRQCQARTDRYLSCRTWTYAITDEGHLPLGHVVRGYINNITARHVYVSVSPSLVAAVPVTNALAERPAGAADKQVGDVVSVRLVSHDTTLQGRFEAP
ncbi:Aste57867_15282 [Aphanomyces stellatus]|uniref:Aste57867_15282 protein n=1 Tax=Aphanomyces stellatus TaxID=120398 RepID=A0A485L5N6_9STRA|nr:hypothetical protein As57867_015226 [Aphanomyces stellatus]VFT92091.1 Aste57867_15282 [Aphanomyces stellatus]